MTSPSVALPAETTPASSEHAPAEGRLPTGRRAELVHAALPFAIAALWFRATAHVPLRDMTDIGLVSVLPRPVFVLLAVLTTSFVLSLRRRPLRTLVPLCHLIVLIVLLYG